MLARKTRPTNHGLGTPMSTNPVDRSRQPRGRADAARSRKPGSRTEALSRGVAATLPSRHLPTPWGQPEVHTRASALRP